MYVVKWAKMKKSFWFFCLGLLVGYALSYLQTRQIAPQTSNKDISENKTLVSSYFPIKKGSFWEYRGTKKEQLVGKIETSEIHKRIEVNDTATDLGIDTLSVTNDGQTEKWLIKGNTVDFEPNEPEDKFILTFPLYVGQKWGDEVQLRNRDDGFYVWEVEQKLPQEVLAKKYDECFRIATKMISGTGYKIFCYGIGVVEEGYTHNGTIFEETYKLIQFKTN